MELSAVCGSGAEYAIDGRWRDRYDTAQALPNSTTAVGETLAAHVRRQYLGSVGKIDNGIVVVSTLWADEERYDLVHAEP